MSHVIVNRCILVLALVVALVAGVLTTGTPTTELEDAGTVVSFNPSTLPACETEDGSTGPLPCVWDAQSRGNGAGRSFWIDQAGETLYLDGSTEAVSMPACAVEDGSTGPLPCYWDATEQGNGVGRSF